MNIHNVPADEWYSVRKRLLEEVEYFLVVSKTIEHGERHEQRQHEAAVLDVRQSDQHELFARPNV